MSEPPKKKLKLDPVFMWVDIWICLQSEILLILRPSGTLVPFLIGPTDKQSRFYVHKEIACASSPMFEEAFNSQFIEGQTQIYSLEDTSSRAFRFLVQSIYKGTLIVLASKTEYLQRAMQATTPPYYELESGSTVKETEVRALVDVWVLADKLMMAEFQNRIMGILYKGYEAKDLLRNAQYVWDDTTETSQIRRLFVYRCAAALSDVDLMASAELLPKDTTMATFILNCKQAPVVYSNKFHLFVEQWDGCLWQRSW